MVSSLTADTENDMVYGAYDSLEELEKSAKELNSQIPEKWYRTSPDPNRETK